MKTSNYISISYLIFLFGGIIVLFSAAKLNPKAGYIVRSFMETKALGSFSVVVAEPGVRLIIKHDSISKILGFHNEGTICKFPPYELRNDTLFFLSYPQPDFQWIQVECNGIKTFLVKENASVRLDEFQGDTLMIKLERATFSCYFDKDEKKNFVLSVISKESQIQLIKPDISKLNIQLNHTIMRAYSNSIGALSGSLKNKSWLRISKLKSVNKANLEVDATSASIIPR